MRKRVRAQLSWLPHWEGAIKGWTAKYIMKNKWRCDSIHSFRDLMQDAYLTFLKISNKYPRVIEPEHFMALYKRALINEIHDRSRYVQRKREVHTEVSEDVSDLLTGRIGELTNSGYLSALLAEAPEELQLALAVLTDTPKELRTHHKGRGPRENLNAKLRRILGFDEMLLDVHRTFDFTGTLKRLLGD